MSYNTRSRRSFLKTTFGSALAKALPGSVAFVVRQLEKPVQLGLITGLHHTKQQCFDVWGMTGRFYNQRIAGLNLIVLNGIDAGSPTHKGDTLRMSERSNADG